MSVLLHHKTVGKSRTEEQYVSLDILCELLDQKAFLNS